MLGLTLNSSGLGWGQVAGCFEHGNELLSSGSAYTQIPHHQQTIPLHNTSTPQVSLHNATNSRKLMKMDVLMSETC